MRTTSNIESSAACAAPGGFAALRLAPALQDAVEAAGYCEPTPIQSQAIPHVLAGRDVLGCAQTGTGKTAAFALPILQRLLAEESHGARPAVRALVLAPTRELAAQITASFGQYGPRGRLRQLGVFGGVAKGPQIQALRSGVDLLVATPGRLLDLMEDGVVSLEHVQVFVLDEADRMLDMGFINDVRRIARALPRRRQTLLFSATMGREIEAMASRLLVDPVRVAVDPIASTCEPIAQSVYFVEAGQKVELLLALLEGGDIDRALVFTRTKHGANRLAQRLLRARIVVSAIHGNKSQSARERALEGFKRGHTRVVVATDVAARGIDVKGLSHVVNFDIPNDPESYVHRVGRTGRAGASGVALSFCSAAERGSLVAIERLTRRALERLETPAGLAPARAVAPAGAFARAAQAPRPRSSSHASRAGGAGAGAAPRRGGARRSVRGRTRGSERGDRRRS